VLSLPQGVLPTPIPGGRANRPMATPRGTPSGRGCLARDTARLLLFPWPDLLPCSVLMCFGWGIVLLLLPPPFHPPRPSFPLLQTLPDRTAHGLSPHSPASRHNECCVSLDWPAMAGTTQLGCRFRFLKQHTQEGRMRKAVSTTNPSIDPSIAPPTQTSSPSRLSLDHHLALLSRHTSHLHPHHGSRGGVESETDFTPRCGRERAAREGG